MDMEMEHLLDQMDGGLACHLRRYHWMNWTKSYEKRNVNTLLQMKESKTKTKLLKAFAERWAVLRRVNSELFKTDLRDLKAVRGGSPVKYNDGDGEKYDATVGWDDVSPWPNLWRDIQWRLRFWERLKRGGVFLERRILVSKRGLQWGPLATSEEPAPSAPDVLFELKPPLRPPAASRINPLPPLNGIPRADRWPLVRMFSV